MSEDPKIVQPSPLSTLLHQSDDAKQPAQPRHLLTLATQIRHNLEHQHQWTSIELHTHNAATGSPLTRPLVSGLPPKRLYISPDEQATLLKYGKNGQEIEEREWVLPTHLAEPWTLSRFAEVFDSLDIEPALEQHTRKENIIAKRVLLAVVGDDSTIVYYFMHDSIVKPRQN